MVDVYFGCLFADGFGICMACWLFGYFVLLYLVVEFVYIYFGAVVLGCWVCTMFYDAALWLVCVMVFVSGVFFVFCVLYVMFCLFADFIACGLLLLFGLVSFAGAR